jgi:Lon protease-like protein
LNTRDPQRGFTRLDLPTHDLPLVQLEGVALFPGTLLPLHAWDEVTCRQLASCLTGERLVLVHGGPLSALSSPGSDGPIAGLGRAVSDRQYPDGRVDVFLHGLARVHLRRVAVTALGLVADVTPAPDLLPSDPRALADTLARLTNVALLYGRRAPGEEADLLTSVLRSTADPVLVSNRLAAAALDSDELKLSLLAERCPLVRCQRLIEHFASALLDREDGLSADVLH